jgi:penicillin G amidase
VPFLGASTTAPTGAGSEADGAVLAAGGGVQGSEPGYASLPIAREDLARRASLARSFRERAAHSPFLLAAMERHERTMGSNHWGVTAERSATGFPLLANDPHLGLLMPSLSYENHLVVKDDPFEGPMNVNGVSSPGVPFVILGQNASITWGATLNPMDVTDTFADKLRQRAGCGVPLCIESGGRVYPVEIELPAYFVNQIGDGIPNHVVRAVVPIENFLILTVPFRSFGPIVAVDDPGVILGTPGSTETTALVLQFTGFHPTREVQTFRIWSRAKNLEDFKEGLRSFDFGSQNWAYADKDGNLAVFTSAENPLRADLEEGEVVGLPPYFVRDGVSGLNNWVPDPDRTQGQSIPFAVLPEEEMPHAINPAAGFFVNANNDPAGTTLDNEALSGRRPSKPEAIYYLNRFYQEGLRAGRITRLIEAKLTGGGKISADDMKAMQANTQQLDAELLVPFLLAAHAHAGRVDAPAELAALHDDPGVAEAVARLAVWDFSTPTGIPEGYDARDRDGERIPYVSPKEAAASVAATLYNLWRAKAIRSIVDDRLAALGVPAVPGTFALKALHHLLVQVPYTGVGASGVDFLPEPSGLSAEDRRDLALLSALRVALDALASNAFRDAFDNSTNQDDYRWGRLHRLTFSHALGGVFNVPPAGGFEDLGPGLPGVARDGGFEVVNASGFNARADNDGAFRFSSGASPRYVGVAGAGADPLARVVGWSVIAGGSSGDYRSPLYVKQLGMWLTADYHPVEMFEDEASRAAISRERFRAP